MQICNGIIGWDIGGAHLKAAHIDQTGKILNVLQLPCALWQGLDRLEEAVGHAFNSLESMPGIHAITMTGELVDLFSNRFEGVKQIISLMQSCLSNSELFVFVGGHRLLPPNELKPDCYENVASMNWMASALCVASNLQNALLLDIGSTTTDLLCVNDHRLMIDGKNDFDRLCSQEMVYTGIVRTPLMAITDTIKFEHKKVGLMAEYFATMADVYRITGELDEATDQYPAADQGDKTIEGSSRRLARMIGRDYESALASDWLELANQIKALQLRKLRNAVEHQFERIACASPSTLVGAGVGRFLAKQLANQLKLQYQDFSDLLGYQSSFHSNAINDCAPAIALAYLALNHSVANKS